jgi:predicted SAM-dependent methyltransferase
MAQVYPRYVQALRNKEKAYRGLLRPTADVVELGPHLGAFLQVAEEWNWNPIGIDVGKDTTEFMRKSGLTVVNGTIGDARLKEGSQDAILIWNCFEQLDQPMETLRIAHRVLRRHGLLVVRVPNVAFYRALRGKAKKVLAYNNLLGFPYLYGYTLETLNRLLARAGFQHVRGFNSELVTMPFADLTEPVIDEQHQVSQQAAEASIRIQGPWIEGVYRRVEQMVQPASPTLDSRFLHRAVA